MKTVYIVKQSTEYPDGSDFYLEDQWMLSMSDTFKEDSTEFHGHWNMLSLLNHYGAIYFVELETIEDLKKIYPNVKYEVGMRSE